ncbi:hypothetical protein Patl1_36058 [Pistacia atlantica]|nr:hypothetical protein Patl1_36058 [Pistacia atlantica]
MTSSIILNKLMGLYIGQLRNSIRAILRMPSMFHTCISHKKVIGKFKNPEFLNQVAVLCKKEDHLVVGCQSGARSHRACVDLLNAGYEHVTEMGGGYSAWVDNGLAQHKPAEYFKTSLKLR